MKNWIGVGVAFKVNDLSILWKLKLFGKTFFLSAGKSCPGGETPCSGNGQCDPTTGFCNCQEGHQGSDCSGIKKNHHTLITNLLITSLQFCDKLIF